MLRKLARTAAVVLGVLVTLWLCGRVFRPDVSDRPLPYSAEQTAAAIASRDVTFDPKHTPSLYVHKKVTPVGESPLLADLVKAGKLPPVAERLPAEPPVMTGADGIGQYGDTWLRLTNDPADLSQMSYRFSGPFMVRWSPMGYPIEPHIAKSVDPSPDYLTWTISLRPGLRWSDGAPYTADDIMYWWDEANDKSLNSALPAWMLVAGKPGRVEKIDDYHVKFTFPQPYPLFLETLASINVLAELPSHYLKQYHPTLGDKDLIAQARVTYKLPSDRAVYSFMKEWQNPECPRMWPWVYRTFKGDPPQVFVRNPYYFVVDTAGNQLPYMDRMQFDVQDNKLLAVSAANGGVSMQGRFIRFSDYTELTSRSAQAGTNILLWYPATRSNFVINPNLNRRIDPKDPATKFKSDLLSDKHFRQALSLAINRKDIIRAEQVGIGTPSQVEPGTLSPYGSQKLANAYVQYDPKRANELLDALGLKKRDNDGCRTFADGSRMTFFLDSTDYTGPGPSQFIVDDWLAVGVRTVMRTRARALFYSEKDSGDFDFNIWTGESDYMPLICPRYFIPFSTESFYCVGWSRWYSRGGFYGNPDANKPNCIPVPKSSPMYQSIEYYEAALRETDPAKQYDLVQQMLDIAAENIWSISIATPTPQPIVVSKHVKNVPKVALWGNTFATPSNAGIETYYFDNPTISKGAAEDLKKSLLTPTLRPGKQANSGSKASVLVSGLIWIAVVLILAMLAVRHPMIGRRLAIMVPTLALISIFVFVLIQLPTGDFLTTKLITLQESNDSSADQQIKDLHELFHFEEPKWKLYARWTGLKWFTSFSPSDEGLLQGNLGRSMQDKQPINNIVGDRITLTVIVSLITILMTWAIALPIGIYSAVRQYSITDYVLTFIGFIGMCVPSFLLALVLIALTGLSGLFSPEFATQPEWSYGKAIDLLKHIWIPVVVLGVGGTAGMIRVMRANLLDELKKPYVTTAMAKGVRPMKLLIKYPVRLALNPFVSGIGHLFPQLISGGAIVAMVLSLPMIGPLQLQAVMTLDTYLAGSMLMVLSLLAVIGTLVSDLLLLWLDPRIRFEGGSR